jgi:hypothetical protein
MIGRELMQLGCGLKGDVALDTVLRDFPLRALYPLSALPYSATAVQKLPRKQHFAPKIIYFHLPWSMLDET